MKLEQKPSEADGSLLDILHNVNKKYSQGRNEYLLLIRRQKQKPFCTMYITDCESKFWIKKVDTLFLEQLKGLMSINTGITIFTRHLATNLKDSSRLSLINDGEEVKIDIQLKIGQGLLMNCSFVVESNICSEESPSDFKRVLKVFLKELYDAKESQIEEERKKWEKKQEADDKNKDKDEKSDPVYVKEVLHGMKKDASQIKPKNRSLLNPNQKKRKQVGIKFQGDL